MYSMGNNITIMRGIVCYGRLFVCCVHGAPYVKVSLLWLGVAYWVLQLFISVPLSFHCVHEALYAKFSLLWLGVTDWVLQTVHFFCATTVSLTCIQKVKGWLAALSGIWTYNMFFSCFSQSKYLSVFFEIDFLLFGLYPLR